MLWSNKHDTEKQVCAVKNKTRLYKVSLSSFFIIQIAAFEQFLFMGQYIVYSWDACKTGKYLAQTRPLAASFA